MLVMRSKKGVHDCIYSVVNYKTLNLKYIVDQTLMTCDMTLPVFETLGKL
jgi:hypothetical protein